MIYLIGGPAKVGKSKLAERLLQEKSIPYIPTDVFIEALKDNKLGNFGVNERATEFSPYFKSLVNILPNYREKFCIEGNGFMPVQVKELQSRRGSELKVCFLGMSEASLELILKYAGPETWLMTDLTEEQRNEYPKWLVKNSQEIQKQCEEYGYQYFDLAGNYNEKFERAYQYLSS